MSTYFCLISRRNREQVLLLEENGSWTLPHTEHDGFYDDAQGWLHLHLQREMQRQLGFYVTTLRHLTPTVCEMEWQDTAQEAPLGAIWADRNARETLAFTEPEHRRILEVWSTKIRETDPLSAPWERVGWFEQAAMWIQDQIRHLGYTAQGNIQQVKTFVFGIVLCVHTDKGTLYFKALLPTVQNEVALILELAKKWPSHVPQIIAYNLERRWMLMRDFGGETFTTFSSPHYETALQICARIQQSCAPNTETWLQLGCPDRRLEKLQPLLAEVIAAALAGEARAAAGLTDIELDKLSELLPNLIKKYQRLERFAIPATIVQQDFQWSNMAIKGSSCVFFDWQDTVISHPFFSMTRFLDYMPVPRGVEPFSPTLDHPNDIRRRELRDAYLEPWQAVAPINTLQEAFALAREVHLSYLAVRWFQNLRLFASEEDESVAWALRQLLENQT